VTAVRLAAYLPSLRWKGLTSQSQRDLFRFMIGYDFWSAYSGAGRSKSL